MHGVSKGRRREKEGVTEVGRGGRREGRDGRELSIKPRQRLPTASDTPSSSTSSFTHSIISRPLPRLGLSQLRNDTLLRGTTASYCVPGVCLCDYFFNLSQITVYIPSRVIFVSSASRAFALSQPLHHHCHSALRTSPLQLIVITSKEEI